LVSVAVELQPVSVTPRVTAHSAATPTVEIVFID
jgi:hypothetical protein